MPIQPEISFSSQEAFSWPKDKEEASVLLRPHPWPVPGKSETHKHVGMLESRELSSKGLCKYMETLQSKDKKETFGGCFFSMSCPEISNDGNTRWHKPLFSIRFFGKVKAQLIGVAQGRASRDTTVGVRLGRTLATLQDLHLMIMTLDHSVPQTWFFPNPLSGNANVLFLLFWLISEIHGWKYWLRSHFFDAERTEKILPPTTHPPIYPPLPPDSQLQVEAITEREKRMQRGQAVREEELRAWKGRERQKKRLWFKFSHYSAKTSTYTHKQG